MGVERYTPNSAIHGDTGWKSTLVRQWLSVTRQWFRLKNMETNRLNRKIFEWAERNGNGRCQNWNYRVNKTLAEAGISYEPGVTNSRMLKATLSDYLFQNFVNSWTDDITRDNARQGTGRNNTPTNHSHEKPRSIQNVHKSSFWFSIRGIKNAHLL